jgi:cytoskeletal protein CcmA (bactofilin family)
LTGQVPAKVIGQVNIGDPITISTTHPGVGTKATTVSRIVGYALTSYTPDQNNPDDIGQVTILIQPELYMPALQGSSMTSLQDLTVSGNTLMDGNLSVAGTLTVTGDAVFEGSLTVQEVVTTANLTVGGRILSANTIAPEIVVGVALGDATTAQAIIQGTDTAGTIELVAGNIDAATGVAAEITFTSTYERTARIALTPMNDGAASVRYYVERTADNQGFTVKLLDTPAPNTIFIFDYIIIGADVVAE